MSNNWGHKGLAMYTPLLGQMSQFDWKTLRSNYTDSTNYPVYAYMFSKKINIPHPEYECISFDEIVECVKMELKPLMGEFIELQDNVPFLEISYPFFEYLILNNILWVSYESEEKETFSLYIKTQPKNKSDYNYVNVITGKNMTLLPMTKVIRVYRDGSDDNTFQQWFDYAAKFLSQMKVYQMASIMWGKVGKLTSRQTRTEAEENRTLAKLLSVSPIIAFDEQSSREHLEVLKLVEADELRHYLFSLYVWKDRQLSELGRVSNINDKEERKTTGENFKDIFSVRARQFLVQKQLNFFALKCKEFWNIELEFKNLAQISSEIRHGEGEGMKVGEEEIPNKENGVHPK